MRVVSQFKSAIRDRVLHRRERLAFALAMALCLLPLCLTAPSPAQADGPTFGSPHDFGGESDLTQSVAVGDLDGDGDLDFVVGNNGQSNVVYLNDGFGRFDWIGAERKFGTGQDYTYSVAVGDLDGDGDLDIVVGNHGQNAIYLNDGFGHFDWTGAERKFGTGDDTTQSVAVGDLDGDGDLDIVVGNKVVGSKRQPNVVYLNYGQGSFYSGILDNATSTDVRRFGPDDDATQSVAVGDMDGDGLLDIVAGSVGPNVVYLNDKDEPGDFYWGDLANAPSTDVHRFGTDDTTWSVAVGDMDGDGLLDIVVGNAGPNVVYLNDKDEPVNFYWGDLASAPSTDVHHFGTEDTTRSVAVGDLDGDGDLDIVVGNYAKGQADLIYLNDGKGNWDRPGTERPFGTGKDHTNSVAVGDLDNDGDLDIVVGNYKDQNVVCLNSGGGYRDILGRDFGTGSDTTWSVAVGDMNNDGHLDIIVGNYGQQNMIYLNDGVGNFAWPGTEWILGPDMDFTTSMAVGDLDSDGDLDIVVGNAGRAEEGTQGTTGEQNVIYLNDGKGEFAAHKFGTGDDITRSVAVGDLDGDGHLDIVVGNKGEQNVIYLNGGQESFYSGKVNCPDARQTPRFLCFGASSEVTLSVAVGDLDGDGALDIVVGNAGQNMIYLNNGQGKFTARDLGKDASTTRSLAVWDLDGDGDLDIVVGNHEQSNVIYLNDGQGNFDWPGAERRFGMDSDDTYSVAVGDLNGDSYLDIAVGNGAVGEGKQSKIYLNDGQQNFDWPGAERVFGPTSNATFGVVVQNMNRDGDLDIVVGNCGQPNKVYLNDGQGNYPKASEPLYGIPWEQVPGFGEESGKTQAVALGDMNGNGTLDVILCSYEQQNVVYLNDKDKPGDFYWGDLASAPSTDVRRFGTGKDTTRGVAVGDLDSDGDLDIVVGNAGHAESTQGMTGEQNVIYLNDGKGRFVAHKFGTGDDITRSVAIGDMDGDGQLDIVVGNYGQQSMVYLNDRRGNFYTDTVDCDAPPNLTRCFGTSEDTTQSVAVGDMNSDGDLDIIVGNYGQSMVYLNDGQGNFDWPGAERRFGMDSDDTFSVAVGDLNGDGRLDIVAGNMRQKSEVYLNDGVGNLAIHSLLASDSTTGVAVGDMDGDGDLDIVVGNYGQQSMIYLNDGGANFATAHSYPIYYKPYNTRSVAVGDIDHNGTLDVVVGNYEEQSRIYLNRSRHPAGLVNDLPYLTVSRPIPTANANFYSSPVTLTNHIIPITYTLSDPDGDVVGHICAYYSLNGGGQWRPAIATMDTVTENLTLSATHIYTWDTFASGVLGQSDNVVFRLEAYPQPTRSDITGAYRYTNSVPGLYQWPYAAATTFPFGVQGSQVRVYAETDSTQLAGAVVYRLPKNNTFDAKPIGGTEKPFQTDDRGYLVGHAQSGGELKKGDNLVALFPVIATKSYTLYHTSAVPTPTGLNTLTVDKPGEHPLVVRSDYSLILFNLVVSLEWDARHDVQFTSQLKRDLQRTSEVLYDWTNGQAALGAVTVYHDREHWNDADIRVYATNRLRPNADVGGIVFPEAITDPLQAHIVYAPGQVRMGAVWNRYGDPSGSLGEDWPRALAHELGHYALYLNDNYLGLDGDFLTLVTGCPGAMSDPYRSDDAARYDEFHLNDASWESDCKQTLSNQTTLRSDWETIGLFYPLTANTFNPGPSVLPLAVTKIRFDEPDTPATTLEEPIFYLVDESGDRAQPGPRARAFLFHGDRITDLGQPIQDLVLARGARKGDELCVYDLDNQRLGCIYIEGSGELKLSRTSDWQPDIQVSPVNSRTIPITVKIASDVTSDLQAQLFPMNGGPASKITLDRKGVGIYSNTFTLEQDAHEGYVRVWVNEEQTRREMVLDYASGGSPGRIVGGGGSSPVLSADGRVILYGYGKDKGENGKDLVFDKGEKGFYTFQVATTIPKPTEPSAPDWATVIGQAYWLSASSGASLNNTSLSFSYPDSAVPPGEENWVHVYFWDEKAGDWQPLTTTRNITNNMVSALVPGPGLYALMSSTEITLYKGENLFAYLVQKNRKVADALLSIKGLYNTVKRYDRDAGTWTAVDSDFELEYGQVYMIEVKDDILTDTITLRLKGSVDP